MTDNQKDQDQEVALIIKTLSEAGWKKTVKAESLGKAEMEYNNGSFTLVVEQGSDPGWLDLSVFDSSDQGSDFSLDCKGRISEVLKTIVSFQDKISLTDYKQYLTELVKVCEIYVDTGDDFVPLVEDDDDDA
jgi:hypothetical protein